MAYMTVAKALAQRKSGAPVSFMMACPLSKIFQLVPLVTPFCSGVCSTVNLSLIPFSAQYFSRGVLTYSPPRSEHRILVCVPYWFTKSLSSLMNHSLKSDFTEWFIKLDRLFVNQYGTHTKILCSDRGGEYVNTPLEKYCAENGIKLKFTVLHTPEQNGVTKGTNWKILDKGQAIMKDTGAPDFLWANAFATVMYAMNRTISTRAGD